MVSSQRWTSGVVISPAGLWAKPRQLVFPAIAVGLDAGWPLEADPVEQRVARLAVGFPHLGERCALRVPGAANGNLRIMAASCGVQRDLGKVGSARRMLRPFERQHADRSERNAVAFPLVAQLDDPTAHAASAGCGSRSRKFQNTR